MSMSELEKSMEERAEDIPGAGSIIAVEIEDRLNQSISKDPLIHRSKGMRCATGMWFVCKESDTPTIVGRCRRHAPTMNGYPVVYDTDWCGDHKVDETKV